jgi:hypothetical protein
MTHQMGAGVANDLDALLVLGGNDLEAGILGNQVAGIHEAAVNLAGHGGLGKTGTNGGRHFGDRNRVIKRADRTVREGNGRHGVHPSAVVAATSGHMTSRLRCHRFFLPAVGIQTHRSGIDRHVTGI